MKHLTKTNPVATMQANSNTEWQTITLLALYFIKLLHNHPFDCYVKKIEEIL
jgi:hypothetical protein